MSAPLRAKSDVKGAAFEAMPFISPRNVPLWAAVTVALVVIALVVWLG